MIGGRVSWMKTSSRRKLFNINISNYLGALPVGKTYSSFPASQDGGEQTLAGRKDSETKTETSYKKQTLADRDFFLNVLNSSTTKREAKSYLSRFTPAEPNAHRHGAIRPDVNLGNFFGSTRAVEQSPRFSQIQNKTFRNDNTSERLHVTLITIRAPEEVGDTTLQGIGNTILQLNRLGMKCVVMIDCKDVNSEPLGEWRREIREQGNRLATAFDSVPGLRSRVLNDFFGMTGENKNAPASLKIHRNLLFKPLIKGLLPIILPLAYTTDTPTATPLDANDVLLTLTREFANGMITSESCSPKNGMAKDETSIPKQASLDRLIILDPFGGIPSSDRPSGAHVFINMKQEFEDIQDDLEEMRENIEIKNKLESTSKDSLKSKLSSMGASNPFSKFVESEVAPGRTTGSIWHLIEDPRGLRAIDHHVRNLEILQQALALLPSSSSALVTTPQEAANSGRPSFRDGSSPHSVGTRRQRNTLIHNLLTDKPVFSSSLPLGRLGAGDPTQGKKVQLNHASQATHTTFIKNGMPLVMLPDPRVRTWAPPKPGEPKLTLQDSRLDLGRLVRLIEDSFGRKLDVEHYLKRVNDNLAGLIIAGDYEGGAILTWELPPGVVDDGSENARSRMVPYLDKFAVLRRCQGAGGVADIVFTAMVKGCFPHGVCWRSRRDNPVNKWYFERAKGSWKLTDSNWIMFWTTPDVMRNGRTFMDYEAVCRSVVPSWADKEHISD